MTLASSGFRLKRKGKTVEKHCVTADRIPWYVLWSVTSKKTAFATKSIKVSGCRFVNKKHHKKFSDTSPQPSVICTHFLPNAQGPECSFRPQWFALKVRGSFSLFSLWAPLLRSPLCPIITRQFPLGTCLWDVKLAKCFLSLCAISDVFSLGRFHSTPGFSLHPRLWRPTEF